MTSSATVLRTDHSRTRADRNGRAKNRPQSPDGPQQPTASPPEEAVPGDADSQAGRDGNGRFTKGNRFGCGNPFARRMANLRSLLFDAVSEDDLQSIVRQIAQKAKSGDLAAAKLVLAYLIGRPGPAVDPDRVDVAEVRLYQELPTLEEVFGGLRNRLGGKVAPEVARQIVGLGLETVMDGLDRLQTAETPDDGETAEAS